MKSADFHVDFTDFVDFHVDFTDFGLKLVKLTISFHSTVRIQGGTSFCFENPRISTFLSQTSRGHLSIGILCETKDHLPKKVTIFLNLET